MYIFVNIWGIFQLVCIPIGSSQGDKEHVDLMAFDDYGAKLCYKCEKFKVSLTLKEPGSFDPSHSQRGADSAPPLRSRKPIDETSSVSYYLIAMTLPSPLV